VSSSGPEPSAYWWWTGASSSAQRPVLFFPPSGAEQSVAGPLANQLGDVRFGVLRLPGRGARHDEPHPHDISALIEDIAASVAALDGPPPMLVGHSFGGLLGYGVADALQRRGAEVGLVMPIASVSPAAWLRELNRDAVLHPGEDGEQFVARRSELILGSADFNADVLTNEELAGRARSLIGVDVRLSRQGFPVRTISAPIVVIRAGADRMVAPESLTEWALATTGGHRQVTVPGTHFFYRERPMLLASHLRMELHSLDSGRYFADGFVQ
jgi:surfactin synthase thioesterase subunit